MSFWKVWQRGLLLLSVMWMCSGQKTNCVSAPSSRLGASYDVIANFQSGTVKLEKGKTSSRYNFYNISLSSRFNSSYDIAVSIQNINSFKPTQGYDFFVNGIKRATMIQVVLVIDVSTVWTYAQIYFLASARADFNVGFFVADNAAFLQLMPNGGSVALTQHLPHVFNVNSNFLYAIPFISGVRTFDLATNFSFTSARYDSSANSLTIQLLVSFSKAPIESLYLSYLIFNMDSDLEITSFTNLSYAPSNINVFIGVSGIIPSQNSYTNTSTNSNSTSNSSSSSTSSNGTRPLLAESLQVKEQFDMIFGINGVIIQTQQSLDLLFRALSPSNSNVQVLECVSKSKCNSLDGTMIYQQSDVFTINSKCLVCMSNGFYNQTIGDCQCIKGYYLSNGTCLRISDACPQNSTYNAATMLCECNTLFVNISGNCVSIYSACPQGQIYFKGACIRIVYSNANTANCPSDCLFINKTCVKKKVCTSPFILNNSTNQCDCPANTRPLLDSCAPCSTNQTLVGSNCSCKSGYFRIQGNCLACSTNAFFNGTTCVCFRYYSGDGFKCQQTSTSTAELAKSAPKGTFAAQASSAASNITGGATAANKTSTSTASTVNTAAGGAIVLN